MENKTKIQRIQDMITGEAIQGQIDVLNQRREKEGRLLYSDDEQARITRLAQEVLIPYYVREGGFTDRPWNKEDTPEAVLSKQILDGIEGRKRTSLFVAAGSVTRKAVAKAHEEIGSEVNEGLSARTAIENPGDSEYRNPARGTSGVRGGSSAAGDGGNNQSLHHGPGYDG